MILAARLLARAPIPAGPRAAQAWPGCEAGQGDRERWLNEAQLPGWQCPQRPTHVLSPQAPACFSSESRSPSARWGGTRRLETPLSAPSSVLCPGLWGSLGPSWWELTPQHRAHSTIPSAQACAGRPHSSRCEWRGTSVSHPEQPCPGQWGAAGVSMPSPQASGGWPSGLPGHMVTATHCTEGTVRVGASGTATPARHLGKNIYTLQWLSVVKW